MANSEFWRVLCGSHLARQLGITDHNKDSLHSFDQAYLDLYPYLLDYVRLHNLVGQRVLEIGLGYGTLGQKIAESAEWYQGLDISMGPVQMMNHRIQLFGKKGVAVLGSARSMPFTDKSFDQVISIGCFHHTGNAAECVRETYRVLRPGGRALVMLYSRYSYRQWTRWPFRTASAMISEKILHKKSPASTERQRKAYDAGLDGEAAPETDFFSKKQIFDMFDCFSTVKVKTENCTDLGCRRLRFYISRKRLLPYFGRFLGLDFYIEALKNGYHDNIF